ncbi:MAG: RNA polymerase sigma factor [Myxococcota bacterium]
MARRDPTSIPSFDPAGPGAPTGQELAAALDAESARRLHHVALRITRDPAAADDVVQSAFEKALRHCAGFRGEARPTTWLHRIVVNEALMWHRSESRRRARLARSLAARSDDDTTAPSPLDGLLVRELRDEVRRALAKLRPEDADLLAHWAVEDHGYASWAQKRGMRPTAVKTRAFRARRALKAVLEEDAAS